MTKVTLYIAASLDGYIARSDGGIDWLSILDTEGEDYGYTEFYESIDAIVLGSNTYQVALGFNEWPYPEKNPSFSPSALSNLTVKMLHLFLIQWSQP
ncbi:MAG: hypothetical protein V7K25_11790 [Nostoc sp.]|uniref:dihydrofolate reductase family protein n=1 Tax=Nostoc sp. TaxID=1180 RepID=UPI002FFBA6F1